MRWWRRLTLRGRLTFVGSVGLAVGLAVGGLLINAVLHYVLIRSVDTSSRQTASDVAELVQAEKISSPIPSAGTAYVQVLDDKNRILAVSSGPVDRLVPLLGPAQLARAVAGNVVVVPADPVGVTGDLRVVAQRTSSDGERRVVIVASPTHAVEESAETVRIVLLIAYPLLLAALAAFTWRVVGWALRPVEELRQGAAMISASGRNVGRLPVPDGDDEVNRLAVTLNDMLNRLDMARIRQRAFVADAAHELRSPIASLRTQLEVADRLDEPALVADLLTDVGRLGRLVDDLLLLARADEGDPRLRLMEAVDAGALAAGVVDGYANARVPVIFGGTGAPLWTVGDPTGLRRIVDNLVGNAKRHAATRVVVSAAFGGATHGVLAGSGTEPDDGDGAATADTPGAATAGESAVDPDAVDGGEGLVTITIRDDGPGIPAADRERVFDRFTRLDNSRVRDDDGGAGLGLAIVRELLRLHGGSITLSDAEPGLRVEVTLPGAVRDPEAGHAEGTRDLGPVVVDREMTAEKA